MLSHYPPLVALQLSVCFPTPCALLAVTWSRFSSWMLQFAGCETDAQRQLRKDLGSDVASEIVRPATSLARL
jgi:hypothetical protein